MPLLSAILSLLVLTLPAAAATPFDGVYKGGNTSAGGAGMRCPPGSSFSVKVLDGVFNWKHDGASEPVQVGPDGSFNGRSGMRFIVGRVVDGKMTATTSGTSCNYAWSLSK